MENYVIEMLIKKWQRNHMGTAADVKLLVPVICTDLLGIRYAVLQVWSFGSDLELYSWACQKHPDTDPCDLYLGDALLDGLKMERIS